MEPVRFIRGTLNTIKHTQLAEGAFYQSTDTNELFMVMHGQLVQLDNSIYWVNDTNMLTPLEVNKRLAYNLSTQTFYIANEARNEWCKPVRDASIDAGTLIL